MPRTIKIQSAGQQIYGPKIEKRDMFVFDTGFVPVSSLESSQWHRENHPATDGTVTATDLTYVSNPESVWSRPEPAFVIELGDRKYGGYVSATPQVVKKYGIVVDTYYTYTVHFVPWEEFLKGTGGQQ